MPEVDHRVDAGDVQAAGLAVEDAAVVAGLGAGGGERGPEAVVAVAEAVADGRRLAGADIAGGGGDDVEEAVLVGEDAAVRAGCSVATGWRGGGHHAFSVPRAGVVDAAASGRRPRAFGAGACGNTLRPCRTHACWKSSPHPPTTS